MTTILALRFTRRAIGAAAIADGEMSLLDGRFLSPRPERTVPAAVRYVEKMLALTRPGLVAIDAPPSDGPTRGAALVREVDALLARSRIPVLRLDRQNLLTAFGVTRLVDRRELRDLIRILWPDVERVGGKVKPHVADAAAAGLYAETEAVFRPADP